MMVNDEEQRNPYPLSWPRNWTRTPEGRRTRAKFAKKEMVHTQHGGWQQSKQLTIPDALKRLTSELDRLGAKKVLISSNIELRMDGLPRSDQRIIRDPGVAVYFVLAGKDRVLACDKWDRVADNIAAIAAHIDAIRRQDRYGVGTIDQAFAGYAALPGPSGSSGPEPWHVVLGVRSDAPTDDVMTAYKRLAREHHPDMGGNSDKMAQINAAYAQFQHERGLTNA